METQANQKSQSDDQETILWLEQFPAEVLQAALLILRERQFKPNG